MGADSRYRVKLVARNEGVDYIDERGIYHFNVSRAGREWVLPLPVSKGHDFQPYELTTDERAEILPRIVKYLERVFWFGIFPRSYTVRVVEEQHAGHSVVATLFSRTGPYRAVVTRETAGTYHVYRERRDMLDVRASGPPSWQPETRRDARTFEHATAIAKTLLTEVSDGSDTKTRG